MENVDAFGSSEDRMVYGQENQHFRTPTGEVIFLSCLSGSESARGSSQGLRTRLAY